MTFSLRDPGLPSRMEELSEGERLIVWCYRRWIVGMQTHEEGHWIRVWRELGCTLGLEGARTTLGGLQRLIREVATHARRPVRLHPPCCGMICADELSVVGLIGACQRHDHQRARHLAEWLVRAEGVGDIIEAARIVADALADRRFFLPNRIVTDRGSPDWIGRDALPMPAVPRGEASGGGAKFAAPNKDRI